ncbi:hypothetical protein LAZ67_13001789 [Cordylochernes scorpioides]|uniref:Uncharacterized protein n=1 Tax=Cordylochernes scorpioides TaxID=51811 RepID=A0ABY6L440_9ARAC|nr:hypothetical protein LAZ67_13001789 [Cordylochernes scorpioides]
MENMLIGPLPTLRTTILTINILYGKIMLSMAMEDSRIREESKSFCFGNKMDIEIVFDYLKGFTDTFRTPRFSYTFVAGVTHNKLNTAGHGDHPAYVILKQLFESGALNNSFLFFFSDHGLRFGEIRQTYIGHFEERMPIAYLRFPDWFYQKYPKFYSNLKTNQKRLTTHFDIHATLQHLLALTWKSYDFSKNDFGKSLLAEIPDTRTCSEAGIPDHFCTCHVFKPVSKNDPVALRAAAAIISSLNAWLSARAECSLLKLESVIEARTGTQSETFLKEMDDFIPWFTRLFEPAKDPYDCERKTSFLRVFPNCSVELDAGILSAQYSTSSNNLQCQVQPILRDTASKTPDDAYVLGSAKELVFGHKLDHEFALVNCQNVDKKEDIFLDFVSCFPISPSVKAKQKTISKEKEQRQNFEPLNVILLGIDSLSQLNFIRHFPKTKTYLEEILRPIKLSGYTKVGENTFPNLTPLFTGKYVNWTITDAKDYYFDDQHFIWKDYAKYGYVTLFSEDCPTIATFNYLKNGFKNPPADYYLRPLSLAMEDSRIREESKSFCFGNKMDIEIVFDYLKGFTDTFRTPRFSYTFVAGVTHNKLNTAGHGDHPAYVILKQLFESGALNNSFLFFFSDHGLRFGEIRQTYIGHFEERMPIAYLRFPDWFYQKYPKFYSNLKTNQKRLTTHFDIHATLQHLLALTWKSYDFSKNDFGKSLLAEIPDTRTCSEAGIPDHFCTCHVFKPVSKNDPVALRAAAAIISSLNAWLSARAECSLLKLESVIEARTGTQSETFLKEMDDFIPWFRPVQDMAFSKAQSDMMVAILS